MALKRLKKFEPSLCLLLPRAESAFFVCSTLQSPQSGKSSCSWFVLNFQTTDIIFQQPLASTINHERWEEVHCISAIKLCQVLPPQAKAIFYVGVGLPPWLTCHGASPDITDGPKALVGQSGRGLLGCCVPFSAFLHTAALSGASSATLLPSFAGPRTVRVSGASVPALLIQNFRYWSHAIKCMGCIQQG